MRLPAGIDGVVVDPNGIGHDCLEGLADLGGRGLERGRRSHDDDAALGQHDRVLRDSPGATRSVEEHRPAVWSPGYFDRSVHNDVELVEGLHDVTVRCLLSRHGSFPVRPLTVADRSYSISSAIRHGSRTQTLANGIELCPRCVFRNRPLAGRLVRSAIALEVPSRAISRTRVCLHGSRTNDVMRS